MLLKVVVIVKILVVVVVNVAIVNVVEDIQWGLIHRLTGI